MDPSGTDWIGPVRLDWNGWQGQAREGLDGNGKYRFVTDWQERIGSVRLA